LKKLVKATSSSDKGKILFEDARDYEGAIAFLDTVSTAQAFYYSGLSYERLYLKEGKVRLLDKARERYENLCWQFPDDALVEDAIYRLFATEIRDPIKKMDEGLDYLDHYPEGRYSDEVKFLLGGVELARGDTVAAKSEWENLYLTKPKSPYNLPVLYSLARLLLAQADTGDASAKLALIISIAPHDTVYFLSLRDQAVLDESGGRNLEALSLYRNMAKDLGTIPSNMWKRALNLIFKLKQYNELDEFKAALDDAQYRDEIDFWRKVTRVETQVARPDDVKSLMHSRPAAQSDAYLYWTGVGLSLIDHSRLGRHLLERLVKEGRDSALISKADFLIAQHQLAGGEDSNAVSTLRRLYASKPDDTLILGKLVTALYRAGELKEADSLWMRLDLLSPGDQSPLLLEKVAYLLNAGRVEEADTILTSLSNVRSLWQNENFVYYKGFIAARSGRQEEAIDAFRRFLSDFPKSPLLPAVHFKLGTLFYMMQEMDSAEVHYSQAVNAPDLRASALRNLATIARNRQQWNKAFEFFEILINESSSPEERGDIYTELGITAYNAYKFSQAVTYFEKAAPLVTKDRARLLYWTARSYAAFADPEHTEKAVSLFLKCHEEFPQDQWGLESWMQAGSGYVQLERFDDARVIFQAIVASRGPNDPFGMRAQEALDKMQ
jgi:TolA-binding protein